jgi:hypothetical protein
MVQPSSARALSTAADADPVQAEEVAGHADLGAGQQRAQHGQCLIHTVSPGRRVDAAGAELGRIFAPNSAADVHPPGRERDQRGHLTCYRHRVPQRQQIYRSLHGDPLGQRGKRRGIQ